MSRSKNLFLLFSVWLGASAFAQSRIDCSAINSRVLKQSVRFCVYVPSGYDAATRQNPPKKYDVLYFLHGLGDNEQTLFNSGGWTLIDDLRNQHKIGDFLIVAPDGRRSFFINSANGKVRYSDFFVKEFLPFIESKYHVRKGREGRAISGVSMGGYGALRFAFAYPELFSAVSAQSAALITETPKQLDVAMSSGSPLAGVLAAVFGSPIHAEHWRENNVFDLAKEYRIALRKLAIYFNCGEQDNYGFEKGAAALDLELRHEKVPHEYRPYPGDHSLDYFLSHFTEVMEFHSHAFGLLGESHSSERRP